MNMRRLVIGACALVVAAAALVNVSAQAADPFLGTWKTNLTKSQYDPPNKRPANASILKREVVGDGFRVTSDGRNGEGVATHIEYTVTPDEKDYPLKGTSSADTVAVKRIDAHTQIQLRKKAGVVVSMFRQVISPDGKTLTSEEIAYNAQGASHNVLVFDKQ
jgi:hypothetical protein